MTVSKVRMVRVVCDECGRDALVPGTPRRKCREMRAAGWSVGRVREADRCPVCVSFDDD